MATKQTKASQADNELSNDVAQPSAVEPLAESAATQEQETTSAPAQQSEAPAAPSGEDSQAQVVECAVLYDNIYGKHDDIIELPAEQAAAAAAAGYVDTHPNAIKAIRGQE